MVVPGNHWQQHTAPVIRTGVIATSEHGPFHIAELIEKEQRVVAAVLEVPVVGGFLLIAVRFADGTVHVEDQFLERLPLRYCVDPLSRQTQESREVRSAGKHLRLEPSEVAARRGHLLRFAVAATHDVPHLRVDAQPLRVVRILVAGQPAVNRLSNEWQQGMTGVAAGAGVLQPLPRGCRESQRLVEFSIRKQTSVAGYLAPHERQPHGTVEIDT